MLYRIWLQFVETIFFPIFFFNAVFYSFSLKITCAFPLFVHCSPFLLIFKYFFFVCSWLCVHVNTSFHSWSVFRHPFSLARFHHANGFRSPAMWKSPQRDRRARSSNSIVVVGYYISCTVVCPSSRLTEQASPPPPPFAKAYNHIRSIRVLAFWPHRITVAIHRRCRITKDQKREREAGGGIKTNNPIGQSRDFSETIRD